MAQEYDVVIVGSGIAGALCAEKLSRTPGRRILILEAGDNGITSSQHVLFQQNLINQARYRDSMHGPYRTLKSRYFAPSPENSQSELEEQRKDKNSYYDYTDKSRHAFKAGYNRVVGGSTWSWRGNCPRLLPNDFKMKSKYQVGRDWPLDYHKKSDLSKTLEDYYCEAEVALGVSGNAEEWRQLGFFGSRSKWGFPMPAIDMSYSDKLIKKRIHGRTVAGTQVRVVVTPQARNSKPYQDRPACDGLSTCIPLCSTQAKYNATVHLRRALATERVVLKTGMVVTRLECGSNPRKVTKVRFKDWRSNDPQYENEVSARVVVLAAHAIETPKILLMSELANSSDQVGRNLMDHVQFELIGLFPEPVYPFRGPQSITSIEDFRDGEFRRQHSAFRMTIGNDGWGRTGSPAAVIRRLTRNGVMGSALPVAAADQLSRMVRLSFSTEMLPNPNNRIELSPHRDRLGIRRPMFTFDVEPYTETGLKNAVATGKELFKLMDVELAEEGLQRSFINRDTGRLNWSTGNHIMGTTVMGTSARDSVVNPEGRTHDLDNVWIVGSSVFPTGGTANSTLTIAALTLRTAEYIENALR